MTSHDQLQLRRHGIYRIYHIVIFRKREVIGGLRQEEALVCIDPSIRIYAPYTFLHDIDLVPSYRIVRRDDLAVQIRVCHGIAVYNIERAYTASCQRLAYISAHAAYAEYRDPRRSQSLQCLRPYKELRARVLIFHQIRPSSASRIAISALPL